tara:strand:+ start:187 stop:669 length:483 start_codon:yes stop_codon:yes gene_type:complete
MSNSIKTNSVAKTIKTAKKVVTRKPLTKAQKEAIAKKRALNPQFANVQSAKRRTEKNAYKTDAILCLLEVKRTATLNNVNVSSYENKAYQNECKKAINFMVKNQDKFLPLLTEAVRTYKGDFVVYYFEQLIQKVVKLKMDKNFDFVTSLNYLITAKEVNA